jgi:hypothetical protein
MALRLYGTVLNNFEATRDPGNAKTQTVGWISGSAIRHGKKSDAFLLYQRAKYDADSECIDMFRTPDVTDINLLDLISTEE